MSREILVNAYQNNWQRNPDVAAFDDGGFVIVFDSFVNDYDDGPEATVVAMQQFDAQGRYVGLESLVDGIDGTSATDASVAVLSDGAFAVTWLFDNYGPILTTRDKVYVRVFERDGTPRTEAIRVDTVPGNDAILPEVFATDNGGFTVVFGVDRSTDTFDQIYRQSFDADGLPIGSNRLVNVNEGDFDQFHARSAVLADGSAITVWNSEGSFPTAGDLDSNEVRGMLTAPDGTVLREDFHLTINYGTVGSLFGASGAGYDVAALADGGFVVTNKNYDFELGLDTDDTSYYGVMRFFDSAGNQTGGPVVFDASDDLQGQTRVAQLENGTIVVVWDQEDDTPRFVGDTIYGRLFTAEGVPLTGRFDVGVQVPSFVDQVDPEIEALPGGGFVVTYMSDYVDSDDEGVAARIFGRGSAADDVLRVDVTGQMAGMGGDDRLIGNAQANVLDGGSGNDRLVGKGGGDLLFGDKGNDSLLGAGGDDGLFGGPGRDRVEAGAGNDVVSGDGGNDVLDAGPGNDLLTGGTGRDRLWGGTGRDTLTGGRGNDDFVFAPGDRADTVADFGLGRDRIDLSAWDIADLDALKAIHRVTETAVGLRIDFGGGDVLTVADLALSDLRPADFLF